MAGFLKACNNDPESWPGQRFHDMHQFEFPAAIFVEHKFTAPRRRPHLLAAAIDQMIGRDAPECERIMRARAALKSL